MAEPEFPIFDRAGCPYKPGTADHVAFAVGFRAALLMVLAEVTAAHSVAIAASKTPRGRVN